MMDKIVSCEDEKVQKKDKIVTEGDEKVRKNEISVKALRKILEMTNKMVFRVQQIVRVD